MMGPTTVAVIAAILVHGTPAPAAHTAPSAATAITADEVIRGRVRAIEVAPAPNGTAIVVDVDAAVALNHFRLDNPTRIVVDLGGADLGVPSRYDGKARGVVRNIRLSQFRTDTARLVIDLDGAHNYTVERDGNSVRINIEGPSSQFARWMVGRPAAGLTAVATGRLESPVAVPAAPADSVRKAEPQIVEPVKPEIKAEAPKSDDTRYDAAVDMLTPRTPASVASITAARRQQQKPRITVSYDGTSIRDVIAAFATFSGRTIVVGKDVEGTVTADIADKPWDVALQAILQSQGLAATEDASGIISVDSYRNLASNQSLEPLVTQVIDINYAKASVLRGTVQALLARDCTGLSTMQTGRDLGMPMNQGGGGGGAGAQQQMGGQGCVVRGSVAADSATNKLIITEVPSRLPEIVSRIQQLDIRTRQVAIKAKIIFVNRTGIQDIGLAYDLGTGNKQFFQQLVPRTDPATLQPIDTDGDGVPDATGGGIPFQGPARIALGGNAIAGIANANNAIKPNALNLIYSTALGRYQLTAFLNALQTSSLADVQSEPSITILNNRSAEIFVGQEIPIRVIDAGGQGAQGGAGGGAGAGGAAGAQAPNAAAFFPRAAVSKEEAGIKLSVTPQITNNKMVLMNIKAENSSAEISQTDVGVIFNRQRAESQVLVADGEAAVIGGLTVTETTRFRSGIPVLMNLPFVGRLFSQNAKNETKRDLLILVTPHILDDDVTTPPGR